jgi:hypothetical protein
MLRQQIEGAGSSSETGRTLLQSFRHATNNPKAASTSPIRLYRSVVILARSTWGMGDVGDETICSRDCDRGVDRLRRAGKPLRAPVLERAR